ncbi:MAG: CPBP family intramembrane metalloprotease [Methyloprofundus sp.]|nr:CPBP family intramembrane metalloprotease [Methyloprofundus sp.]
MLKKIAITFIPFAMLLLYSFIACFIGYGLFLLLDGAIELRRLISRTTQVVLILSIYPVMRWLNNSAADLGFIAFKPFIKQLVSGVALGIVTLLPVLLLSYALGITVFDETVNWHLGKVLTSLLVTFLLAVLISLLEEPMFRGILITAYLKRIGVAATIFVSSFYYAILHFIKTKTVIPIESVSITDSFALMAEAFQNLLNAEHLGAFWALLMVGVFLAIMRTRLQLSLAWCIGCHAAWVWQIKMAHKITEVNYSSDLLYLISPYDGVIGPMVAMWLSAVVCMFFGYEYFLMSKVRG